MSFKRGQYDADNQARLATIAGATVGSVETVEEALLRNGPIPFLGTLYDGSNADPREVASSKDQRRRVKLIVIIVTDSWHSREHARDGALDLIDDVDRAIVTRGARYGEWQNPQCETPYQAERDQFVQREGKRVSYQAEYYAYMTDDFNE